MFFSCLGGLLCQTYSRFTDSKINVAQCGLNKIIICLKKYTENMHWHKHDENCEVMKTVLSALHLPDYKKGLFIPTGR